MIFTIFAVIRNGTSRQSHCRNIPPVTLLLHLEEMLLARLNSTKYNML